MKEKRTSVRNGVGRLIFVGMSILLQTAWLIAQITKLNKEYPWISLATSLLALILVLVIYGQHQTSAMKMPWIILILVFPIMGVTLYLMIGVTWTNRRMNLRYKKVDAQLFTHIQQSKKILKKMEKRDLAEANLARYVQKYAGYPVYEGTGVEFYNDALKGVNAQKEELKKAKKFIFMEYHAIEDAESWWDIQEILAQKVKEGVEVRLFYDDIGSIGFISTDFVKRMEKLGIQCRVFNQVVPVINAFLNNRDHRKITVIDGKVGFTGGYNLANEYFNLTHPYGHWKDTGIKLTGEAVRSLTVMFLEMWNAVKDSDKENTHEYFPEADDCTLSECFLQPYADNPMDNEQIGENVYMNIIGNSRKYVYFMTPYLIITDEMNHALGLAAKRGVDVRIITPGIPDKKLVYMVTRSYYAGLVRNGVRIYEYTPGFCHAKQCVSDDRISTCGTINLDYRSLYHHFENGCIMYDQKIAHEIKMDFEETFKKCREVTEKYISNRTQFLRIGQCFLRLFAQLL